MRRWGRSPSLLLFGASTSSPELLISPGESLISPKSVKIASNHPQAESATFKLSLDDFEEII
jgi:hypothetical protein